MPKCLSTNWKMKINFFIRSFFRFIEKGKNKVKQEQGSTNISKNSNAILFKYRTGNFKPCFIGLRIQSGNASSDGISLTLGYWMFWYDGSFSFFQNIVLYSEVKQKILFLILILIYLQYRILIFSLLLVLIYLKFKKNKTKK